MSRVHREQDGGKWAQITALTYTGAVPRPHPPCTAPTPDEEFRQRKEQRSLELEAREQRQQHAANDTPPSHGNSFLSNVTGNLRNLTSKVVLKMERAGAEVTNATESKLRQLERQFNVDRFMSTFPELGAMGEVLLADYTCAAMHARQRVKGHLQITKNYLCFSAHFNSAILQATSAVFREVGLAPDSESMEGIRQVIPLTEVASVVLSVALETVDQGPPFFLPIPAPDVLPTSLQVYTTKQQLFQFLDFESIAAAAGASLSEAVRGRPIDRAYNYLDHAWRAATNVPLPGVNYAG